MKVVLLAGGFGTRISEESHLTPKPMIEIGGMPILWHIMKYFSSFGYNDFIICAGYKQHVIKQYFSEYYLHRSDVTFDFTNGGKLITHNNLSEPWRVTIVDTGLNTMTGGRIKSVKEYIGDEPFFMTYGDGLCTLDINELLTFHKNQKRFATLTAIQPGSRFGTLDINSNDLVKQFAEKNKEDGGWINGGYMVLQPEVLDYIEGSSTTFEKEPLEKLSSESQLAAFRYDGFWQCMDTLRDKELLEKLWASGQAPWKRW